MSSSRWLRKTKHWLQMSGPNTSAEWSLARGWTVSSSKQRRVRGNKSHLYLELLGSALCRKAPLFYPNKGFGCLHSGPALICPSLATLGHTVEKRAVWSLASISHTEAWELFKLSDLPLVLASAVWQPMPSFASLWRDLLPRPQP